MSLPSAIADHAPTGQDGAVTLAQLPKGVQARMVRLVGCAGDDSRLGAIGLWPDQTIEILRRDAWGPIIVSCGDARLALDRRFAGEILVAPKQTASEPAPAALHALPLPGAA